MDALDGDNGVLTDRSVGSSTRDLVQFVPFRMFLLSIFYYAYYFIYVVIFVGKFGNNPALLAQETLKEIPAQFLAYTR